MVEVPRRRVVSTEPLDPEAAAWLSARVDLRRCPSTDPAFLDELAHADALIVRTYTRVDDALLDRGPRLRVVARAGVGTDNIDLDACAARDVVVVNAPDANTQAVIEYVVSCLMEIVRPRRRGFRIKGPMDAASWQSLRSDLAAPRQLDEMRLGIWGLGRIGRRLAAVATALGLEVVHHDLLEIPPEVRNGSRPVDRAELARSSDIISLHVDGRPANRGLVDATVLSEMRPDVALINAARGFVVDAEALASFMRSHPEARAWIDVHEPEPVVAANPCLGLDNVVLTPHVAGRSRQALRGMSSVVHDVWAVLEGRAPGHPVRSAAPPPE